jgi:5-methylcytosine-specific restriction enzyme A
VALYNSARWKRLRRAQLSKKPWCEHCLVRGEYSVATDVDHLHPHRGDPQRFYFGTLQSLCHSCHSRKTASETLHGSGEGRGAEKLSSRGENSARGLPREKNSQCEESR